MTQKTGIFYEVYFPQIGKNFVGISPTSKLVAQ